MVCQVWRLVYKSTEWQMSGQMMMIMRYVVYRRLSCKINYNYEKWDYRNRRVIYWGMPLPADALECWNETNVLITTLEH